MRSISLFFCGIILTCLFGCNKYKVLNAPVYVEYFKQGQILLPDNVCNDTLVVIDAKGLNTDMGLIEQGFLDLDGKQIDSVTHLYCIVK